MQKQKDFKKGEHVLFGGLEYKIVVVFGITHPEHLLGGSRAKSVLYVMLEPVEEGAEDADGWVNARRIKKIKKVKNWD